LHAKSAPQGVSIASGFTIVEEMQFLARRELDARMFAEELIEGRRASLLCSGYEEIDPHLFYFILLRHRYSKAYPAF
jgi:hypothetical protein